VIFTSDNGGDIGGVEETLAREMGFKNNGDFRGDKHLIYQGGFRVPFIVRWPTMIQKGAESDRMINLVDIHATLQELVSGKVLDPKIAAADSFSFYPTLRGEDTGESDRETMVMNDVEGVLAIRLGDWKYINGEDLRPPIKKRKPELYNLKQDPAETKNLIVEFPEVAEQMQKRLDHIRAEGSERIAVK
jgi:arylsulfatase A